MRKLGSVKLTVLLACIMMIGILLTGCSAGSTIDTQLTVEADGSGVRTMDIVLNDSVFAQYFSGTTDDLNAVVTANCPAELGYSMNNADGSTTLHFTLNFASTDDYTQKVAAITGEEPEIEISMPDSIWVSGIYVSENFESSDLLEWLRTALTDGGYVDADNANMIFSNGTTEVLYGGETMGVSSTIQLDKIEYISISSIDFLTDVTAFDDYGRSVIFYISNDSMNKKGTEIRTYFEELGCDVTEEATDYGTSFTLKAEHMTAEELAAFDKTVFGEENAELVMPNVDDHFSPFVFSQYLEENISFLDYVVGDGNSTQCKYYVKTAENYHAYATGDFYNLYEAEEEAEQYPGYYNAGSSYAGGESRTYPLLVQREYRVAELNVTLKKNALGDGFKRVSEFVFCEIPEEEYAEKIVERLEARCGEPEEDTEESVTATESGESVAATEEAEGTESVMSTEQAELAGEPSTEETEEVKEATTKVKSKTSKDVFRITIEQNGDLAGLQLAEEKMYGNSSDCSYAIDGGALKLKRQVAAADYLNYSQILGNVNDDFVIHYEMKIGTGAKLQYCNLEDAVVKGGKLKADIYDDTVSVVFAAEKIDMLVVAFWIVVTAGLVFVILLLLKLGVFKKLMQKAASKQQPQTAAGIPVQPQTTEQVSEQPQVQPAESQNTQAQQTEGQSVPKFCRQCGTPRVEGEAFCRSCGNKF